MPRCVTATRRSGLTLLPRLGFNNTFAILVRGADAQRLGLKTISDLAASIRQRPEAALKAGFGYEFLERPDGFKGLSAAYGLPLAAAPRVMDLNLIYRALAAGEIDVTAGDATSGLIEALGLAVLEDDRHYFPVYDAAPVARASVAAAVSGRGRGDSPPGRAHLGRRHAADEFCRGRREAGPRRRRPRVP